MSMLSGATGTSDDAWERAAAHGVTIRYAIHETGFGRLLVAWTPKGVCAASLGRTDEELVQELGGEFPAARTERDQEAEEWVRPFIDYLDGRSSGLDVPLDPAGTAFQMRVWTALQEIPLGEVRSYAEVAEAIGHPTAARAVARACATNRAALIVPCHRVVRSDGSLGGYRWQEERKRRLLEHERVLRGRLQKEA